MTLLFDVPHVWSRGFNMAVKGKFRQRVCTCEHALFPVRYSSSHCSFRGLTIFCERLTVPVFITQHGKVKCPSQMKRPVTSCHLCETTWEVGSWNLLWQNCFLSCPKLRSAIFHCPWRGFFTKAAVIESMGGRTGVAVAPVATSHLESLMQKLIPLHPSSGQNEETRGA